MPPLTQPTDSIHHVVQKKVGYPYGECVRASYASLLKLPMKAVPRFDPASLGGQPQIKAERQWLSSLGLDLVTVHASESAPIPKNHYHLISTVAEGPINHRVVGKGGKVAWNPHPGLKVLKMYRYLFVVPKKV